jgi:c(7)-type cytochrome triheme protein
MKRWFWSGIALSFLAMSYAWAVTGGGDIIFDTEGMPSVVFSHDNHVGAAKKKCSECHYGIYTNHSQHKAVGMAAMRAGKSCGTCHDGKKAFSVAVMRDCGKCHKKPEPQQ